MAIALLETKLQVPVTHGRLITRPRLSEQVARATSTPVTLISAPAGFGKTTVMTELTRRDDAGRLAWVSLDAGDDDTVVFWTYVAEAFERAAPGVGSSARSVLAGGQATVDAALTTLLNALAVAGVDVVLALDDLHAIESTAIHEQLGYFLDHLPAHAHVVLGTRADPPIPLARLRARGGLLEIRAEELRFSPSEASSYLDAMGLALSDDQLAALEGRTEGWIAALQLAALSLQGRTDVGEFIEAFAGDDRYIVDYLVEEVLRRQPPAIRDFLLETSILARLSGPLVDAVTEAAGGAATIESLERRNLFVIALDRQRRWYRYHHLFAGVLQAHLAAERPDDVPVLHRRASDWLAANGDPSSAVEHAFRAGDPEHLADLIEVAAPEMRQFRRYPTLRRWLESIPRDVLDGRPVLSVNLAGTILSSNEVDGVDDLLTGVERRIAEPGSFRFVDADEFRRLPTGIELYRAAVAKLTGDVAGNIAHARRVLDLVGEADHVERGGAETLLGLAYWEMGDLDAGYRWYTQGMASLEQAGLITDVVGGAIVRADIRLAEGRLGDAQQLYEAGLARAEQTQPPLRGVSDMHTGLAEIAYQRNDLEEARAHLDIGRRLGEELGFPREPYRSRLARARVLQAEGNLDAALALLAEAERLYLSDFSPDFHPVPAIRARMLIAHGRLGAARAWARDSGVSISDELSYIRELEHTTLARLLVAEGTAGDRGSIDRALELLGRLLDEAGPGRRDGSRLEILIVHALARHASGDLQGAIASLDAAVAIAEPARYVRVFLDEGPSMTALLKAAAKRSGASSYLQMLARAASGGPDRAPDQQGLVEPLSQRELDVLRLLRSDLSGPEIANELVVSLNTLRTHTKSIYAKLGVTSRRSAVRRAEELGLF